MTHEPDTDGRAEVLVCNICGGTAYKTSHTFEGTYCGDCFECRGTTDPLHAQAKAAGYASVAEWVAGMQGEIHKFKDLLAGRDEFIVANGLRERFVDGYLRAALGTPQTLAGDA